MGLKMFSAYELRDSIVVDSEALIYGYVKDFSVESSTLRISVVCRYNVNDVAVDVDKLKSLLMEKGFRVGDEPLETLVSLARSQGIEVPVKSVDRVLEVLKGYITVDEIEAIDIAKVVRLGREETIKIVLLSTPREALFRGVKPSVEDLL